MRFVMVILANSDASGGAKGGAVDGDDDDDVDASTLILADFEACVF